MQNEAKKRNSEEFGVRIFKDFTGSGCIEVIENELLVIENELLLKRQLGDAFRCLEAVAHFMQWDSSCACKEFFLLFFTSSLQYSVVVVVVSVIRSVR